MRIQVRAPAKVNLFLRILAREDTGFHQIETLFQAIDFFDDLIVTPGDEGVRLTTSVSDGLPIALGPVEENLVYRAAERFLEVSGVGCGVNIHLEKRIPTGAGLGGGSSDAAATLRAVDRAFPGALDRAALLAIAGELGADVPFFLCDSPFALAWGRGDRLLSLPTLPSIPVLLALPDLSVSTPEAYRELSRHRAKSGVPVPPSATSLTAYSGWDSVYAMAENEFEEIIFQMHPELRTLREALEESHAHTTRLSGSGAVLFALYEDVETAEAARTGLSTVFADCRFVMARTLTEFPGLSD